MLISISFKDNFETSYCMVGTLLHDNYGVFQFSRRSQLLEEWFEAEGNRG